MVYYRYKNELVNEKESQDGVIKFLYNTLIGRLMLKVITLRSFSRLLAIYYNSEYSRRKIKKFAEQYNIRLSRPVRCYKSFNDFFTRKEYILFDVLPNVLISPASSKLSVYRITHGMKIKIKNTLYDIKDLTGNKIENKDLVKYQNGYCLVFRLSTSDYHRYIHIDYGKVINTFDIDGVLHTVRSISERYKVYIHNHRIVSVLEGMNLGEYIQIEVGALTIGAINNNDKVKFCKGDEKGYFSYGGSTIVLLIKNNISISEDILNACRFGNEVKVCIGEAIGKIT